MRARDVYYVELEATAVYLYVCIYLCRGAETQLAFPRNIIYHHAHLQVETRSRKITPLIAGNA